MGRALVGLFVVVFSGCIASPGPAPGPVAAPVVDREARLMRALDLLLRRAPRHPFAGASAGDWWAYRLTTIDGPEVVERNALVVATPRGAEDVVVELAADGQPQRSALLDRQEPPALLALVSLFLDLKATRVVVAELNEQRTVGGKKDVVVQRVSLACADEDALLQFPVVVDLFFCTELDGALVAVTARVEGVGNKVRFDLVGMGNGDQARWGRRP